MHTCRMLYAYQPALLSEPVAPQGMDPPEGLDEQQWTAWLRDKEFLEQLMDNTKVRPADCVTMHSLCKDWHLPTAQQ